MSYDIDLKPPVPRCEHCGRDFETIIGPDPTSNLTPIFHLALTGEPLVAPTEAPTGLRVLNGRSAGATTEQIKQALARTQHPEWLGRLLDLEPPNRWGTLSDARAVLQMLLSLSALYPDHVWQIR